MAGKWVFDCSKLTMDEIRELKGMTKKPIVEHMHWLSRIVVDGPVDVDWSDRYGWTALTWSQVTELLKLGTQAFFDHLRSQGLIK